MWSKDSAQPEGLVDGVRIGAGIAAVRVGDVYQVASSRRTNYGGYAVVDASASLWLDAKRQQRLTLSIGNLFDRQYATRLGTASRDLGGASYAYWHLGSPRTAQLRYTYDVGAK